MPAPSNLTCTCTDRIGSATKKKLGNSNQQNEIKETSDERNVEGGMKRDLWSANDGYLKECMAGE